MPLYGWECIDTYTVELYCNNQTQKLTMLTQDAVFPFTYNFTFQDLDMCRYNYSITAFAMSSMVKGMQRIMRIGPNRQGKCRILYYKQSMIAPVIDIFEVYHYILTITL